MAIVVENRPEPPPAPGKDPVTPKQMLLVGTIIVVSVAAILFFTSDLRQMKKERAEKGKTQQTSRLRTHAEEAQTGFEVMRLIER